MIMTPKEKALELWEKYFQLNYDWDGVTKDEWAKEGALIAVDEIRSIMNKIQNFEGAVYWKQVKQEIQLL
jgi:hypothetical protein